MIADTNPHLLQLGLFSALSRLASLFTTLAALGATLLRRLHDQLQLTLLIVASLE